MHIEISFTNKKFDSIVGPIDIFSASGLPISLLFMFALKKKTHKLVLIYWSITNEMLLRQKSDITWLTNHHTDIRSTMNSNDGTNIGELLYQIYYHIAECLPKLRYMMIYLGIHR